MEIHQIKVTSYSLTLGLLLSDNTDHLFSGLNEK